MTVHDMNPTTEPESDPGRIGTMARGIGRLLGRILGFAVIAAAGVAGWFAVDHYVFTENFGTFSAPETPWPAEFARVTTDWDSFALSYVNDGVETHRTAFDATSKITRIAYSEALNAGTEVELSGIEAFERLAGSGEWTPVVPENVQIHVILGVARTEPMHLSTIVPDEALPFTTITDSGDDVDGFRRFDVVVDAPALLEADPVAFYRWNATEDFTSADVADLRWTVDVRPDGYIVRWEGRSSSVENWSEFPADLEFESPLAAAEPSADAPTSSTPTETPPPTTVGG